MKTDETLQSHLDQTPYAALHVAVQNAVSFCRTLEYRYLWIDQYCSLVAPVSARLTVVRVCGDFSWFSNVSNCSILCSAHDCGRALQRCMS